MATILLGTSLRTTIITSLFTADTSILNGRWGAVTTQRIAFMKGTPPTNLNTLGDTSYRSTDVLVQRTAETTNQPFNNSSYRTISGQSVILRTPYATAIASGTATWLLLQSRDPYSYGGLATSTNARDLVLSVTGPTGGGEVILAGGADIIAGASYRLADTTITLPELYNY